MDIQLPPNVPMSELLALSVPEKIALIGALTDSIEALPLPQWQLDELKRRDEAESANPEPTLSWEDAVQRIRENHAQQRPA
jgi:putative addiction module component (TIGR02574 family)